VSGLGAVSRAHRSSSPLAVSLLVAGPLMLASSAKALAGAPDAQEPAPQAPAGGAILLETDHVRYAIGADGRIASILDRRSGKEYLAREPRQAFALLTKAGKTHEPTACTAAGDLVTVEFSEPGVKVGIRAVPRKQYLVFEIASVSDDKVDEVVFAAARVTLSKRLSWISGVAADDDFAVALRALNLQANLRIEGGPAPALLPHAVSAYGLAGARVALVACPASRLRGVLQEVVRGEGLAYSPLGGPFALDAEENRGSYVFATVSEKNVDDWIALARKAGLAQVHLIGWEQSLGHYEPSRELFPNGMDGLKAVVSKIHAAGLRAGMHTLSGGIAPHDPFVTPVPHEGLARDSAFTLADAISATDAAIRTEEPPGDLDTMWAYMGRGNVLRIEDELVQYTGLSRATPFGFTGVTRGAFGTRPAAHPKGARADHLFVRYGLFQPDEKGTLVDEVADCIARAFNGCGFDMIYMDGAEGMEAGWHGVAKLREAIFRRLKGRVLVEASEWGYHSWPFHSRLGAYDYPNWGLKRFIDVHCRDAEQYRAGSLLPAQLGWWAILGPDNDHPAEFPDEIEYLSTKALAQDAPMSFQGIEPGRRPWNARQDEYLEIIGRWERLRLARTVPGEVIERLRAPREEFRLIAAAEGKLRIVPADYATHKITGAADGSASWGVRNRFSPQAARLRVEALWAAAPYDAADGVVLARFDKAGELVAGGAAPGITASWAPAAEPVRGASTSCGYSAESKMTTRSGAWSVIRKDFDPPLDLGKHGAMGVWIHGDGKGELLNFQLTNPPQFWGTWDEHYVRVDFTGWRYVELLLRERDADRYGDHVWPYGGTSDVFRSPLIRDHVSRLSIYYNDLPPGETVKCHIGPVKALGAVKVKLKNPAVTVGGRKILFPVTLESGQYVEMESAEVCRLRDERGALIGAVRPEGEAPRLESGENPAAFTCEGPEGLSARASVTFVVEGDPIWTGMSP